MRSLSVEELLERLQDRFRLLRGSGRSTLDRHQTLRATVSWSYQLLTEDERLFFDRTSVFAGGFDLRAAEMVCGFDPLDDLDVIDLVSSLVDKSMILADRGALGMRYRLLETLRQYGEDQMELRGETALLRDRHAAHYADLVGELDALVHGPRQDEGAERMAIEWDNLRAAHLWALAQGDVDLAERLVDASFQHAIFTMRHEHAAMLRRTVELGDELGRPSTRVLGMLSYWSDMQGSEEESRRFARRGIDVAPSLDHPVTATCWFAFSGATARGRAKIAGGVGRLPAPGRGGGQHTRSRLQLVGAAQPHGRVVARGSQFITCIAATCERDGRPCSIPATDDLCPSIRRACMPHHVPAGFRRCKRGVRTNE